MQFFIPTKEQIQNYQVSDIAPNCFGKSRITEIYAREQDVNGKWFICYHTEFGSNGSTISHSLKEGKLDRSVSLTTKYTSHQLDDIEKAMLIAKKEKATHQDSKNPTKFYKQSQFETKHCQIVNGQFSGWEYWRTYPPEWAEVI